MTGTIIDNNDTASLIARCLAEIEAAGSTPAQAHHDCPALGELLFDACDAIADTVRCGAKAPDWALLPEHVGAFYRAYHTRGV